MHSKNSLLVGMAVCLVSIVGMLGLISCGRVVRPTDNLGIGIPVLELNNYTVFRTYGGQRDEHTKSAISGYVRDSVSGLPISNVFIVITELAEYVKTNSSGYYEFADIEGPELTVTAICTDLATDQSRGMPIYKYTSVGVSTTARNIDFYLGPMPGSIGYGSVEVTVRDAVGSPVEGAQVCFGYPEQKLFPFFDDAEATNYSGMLTAPVNASAVNVSASSPLGGVFTPVAIDVVTGETSQVELTISPSQGQITGEIVNIGGWNFSGGAFADGSAGDGGYVLMPGLASSTGSGANITYVATVPSGSVGMIVANSIDNELTGTRIAVHFQSGIQISSGEVKSFNHSLHDYAPTITAYSTFEAGGIVFVAVTWEAPSGFTPQNGYQISVSNGSNPRVDENVFTKATSEVLVLIETADEYNISVSAVDNQHLIDLNNVDLYTSRKKISDFWVHSIKMGEE